MKGETVQEVAIALTNVGATVLRASAAEASLRGKALDDAAVAEAARLAMSICDPVADQRGDAEYKTAMAGEMTQRALRSARARAPPPEATRRRTTWPTSKQSRSSSTASRSTCWSSRASSSSTACAKSSQHTGPHIGCETSHCGACTVDLDGMSVKSCTVLTVQCEGAEMLTIEGFEQGGELSAVQEGFTKEHGLQCGYCTPGMITRAYRLLKENPNPTEEEIRYWMSGNLCRCTGYQNIVKAVQYAAKKLATATA